MTTWKRLFGVLAFVGAVLLVAPVLAEESGPEEVIEIRVVGNERLSYNAVVAEINTRVGQQYDENLVKADQKRLLGSGHFDSVVVTKTQTQEGVVMTFLVRERPSVAAVSFVGNKAFDDAELAKQLTFGAGESLSLFEIESSRQAVENLYHNRGYHEAKVAYDPQTLKTERRVLYRIVEGPRVVVRKIRFKGNRHFGNWRLKHRVGTTSRFWPFAVGYLDPEQLAKDIHIIRNLYVSKGFLDAKVDRILTFSRDGEKATVTFVVDEGPRYRIYEVRFDGNKLFSDQELTRRLKLVPGEFYTSQALQGDVASIQDTYGELGYIEAEVSVRKIYKERPGLLDLAFRIDEADKYRVGKVVIRGNTVTQSRVVRRELKFYPQQPFNTVAVAESRHRLQETRLFKTASIRPIGREPGFRDVLVQVEETETAQFIAGASFSTNVGLLGSFSLQERNFDILRWPRSWADLVSGRAWRGAGQRFTLSVEPGTELMRFHVDWFQPALFDQPYSLGTKAFLFTPAQEKYDESRYGGVVSFGHRFRNRWYGELASRIEGVEVQSVDDDAPPEIFDDEGNHVLLGLKGTLVRDRTDSRWLPSSGDRIRLSYEQMAGDYTFGECEGDYRIYRTLYVDAIDRKHILSGRFKVGHILGSVPVFERFYGGGHGSVRGFRYRGISPRSAGTDDQIGGEFMAFVGTQYQFPIIGKYIRGVVFLDSGTVEEDFSMTAYRVSAGLGLRWVVPMMGPVPICLDFGFPISKDEQDDTEVFSFSIGWFF